MKRINQRVFPLNQKSIGKRMEAKFVRMLSVPFVRSTSTLQLCSGATTTLKLVLNAKG